MTELDQGFSSQEVKGADGRVLLYLERSGQELYVEGGGWLSPEAAKLLVAALMECYGNDELRLVV